MVWVQTETQMDRELSSADSIQGRFERFVCRQTSLSVSQTLMYGEGKLMLQPRF